MSQNQWDNGWTKRAQKMRYMDHLSSLLREIYGLMKKNGKISERQEAFANGVMAAGKYVGVTHQELEALIEKLNYEVFGMSVEQRKKAQRESAPAKSTDLDEPTFIRWGKKLSL